MTKQKLNDLLLNHVSGASDQEIRELKSVMLSNPYLRAIWEENTKEHAYENDRDIINDILSEHTDLNGFDLNVGNTPNSYLDSDGYGLGRDRYVRHSEILRMLSEFKGS